MRKSDWKIDIYIKISIHLDNLKHIKWIIITLIRNIWFFFMKKTKMNQAFDLCLKRGDTTTSPPQKKVPYSDWPYWQWVRIIRGHLISCIGQDCWQTWSEYENNISRVNTTVCINQNRVLHTRWWSYSYLQIRGYCTECHILKQIINRKGMRKCFILKC